MSKIKSKAALRAVVLKTLANVNKWQGPASFGILGRRVRIKG